MQAVISELAKKDLIDLTAMTVTGGTVGDNIKGVKVRNYDIIRPIDKPYSETEASRSFGATSQREAASSSAARSLPKC